jgi:hypothetical protein
MAVVLNQNFEGFEQLGCERHYLAITEEKTFPEVKPKRAELI